LMKEQAAKWMPDGDIKYPCADISFRWTSKKDANFDVTMHFSTLVAGHERDLRIQFGRPVAVKWEDESFSFTEVPDTLPIAVSREGFRFGFPTLIVKNSNWAAVYADNMYSENDPLAKGLTHYLLVSLNDTLHVLSESKPEAKWIAPCS